MFQVIPIPKVRPIGHKGAIDSPGEDLHNKSLDEILPWFTEKERGLFAKATYKAMYGGRAGRKSHAIAEYILARMIQDAELQTVVFRKYRTAITYSAQLLLKNKVRDMKWERYFEILGNTIRRRDGSGFIAFAGIQDYNATSIKSYENFRIAWTEEATEIDQYSLDLLIPTLRAPGAELIFSWNPDQPTDPVDSMFRLNPVSDSVIIQVSFKDNIFLSDKSRQDEQDMLQRDPDKHAWVWLGHYNVKSNAIIFSGCWRVGTIEDLSGWDGPYIGGDFGFVADPSAAVESWILGNQIYIKAQSYKYGLAIDNIANTWKEDIPGIEKYVIKADSAEPKTIDFLRRNGLPRIVGVEKWPGSVKTGIKWLKSHELILNPDCEDVKLEFMRYRLKTNKAGEVLDEIVDKDNHCVDSIRYAFSPLIVRSNSRISQGGAAFW